MDTNIYQLIKEWHDLKKSGVITEAEFEKQKTELLGNKEEKKATYEPPVRSADEQREIDEEYNQLFKKDPWIKRNIAAILVITAVALLVAFILYENSKEEVLTKESIISKLNTYCIKEFEKDKMTEGTTLFEDRKYIESFYSKINNEAEGETNLEFYPKYSGYTNAWKLENDYKLDHCISSYTFQFDTTKLNDDNRYTETKISKLDINNDGKLDYIVDGYFHDCSGGSGSEGKYFLTFINNAEKLVLTDVLISLPLDYTITENKLVVKGEYKSWFKESVYYFDNLRNKWIYNESESKSYFYEE